jgi:hypothetical protein
MLNVHLSRLTAMTVGAIVLCLGLAALSPARTRKGRRAFHRWHVACQNS